MIMINVIMITKIIMLTATATPTKTTIITATVAPLKDGNR